ncbi:MAG TPA: PEP-CTERM sorting domain-containing protein [Lacipirellulaceae bacterium]|nr:PEP-CTERM sorting domain-containing protein [Lacipirellulaceae bacterium]
MNLSPKSLFSLMLAVAASSVLGAISQADPLPGQVMKFDQEPMNQTAVAGAIYFGHDELSTAYGVGNAATPPLNYDGRFMADDFADNFNTPVVHLTWWGSYLNDTPAAPQQHVQKFLIAFESDVPANTATGTPSHPGCTTPGCNPVLHSEVVTLGPLSAGSGTFTETLERPAPVDPVLHEALYKYNAELSLPFKEQKDTVYWLKIAALVDVPQPLPQPVPPGTTQWGWHNRDYTIQDGLAAPVSPNVTQGEYIDGNILGQNIYHFQDDAVQGDLRYTPGAPPPQDIVQLNMSPANYQFVNSAGVGPIDGPPGIELHSKDLAFRLYTTSIPEPTSCILLACGALGLALARRRRS